MAQVLRSHLELPPAPKLSALPPQHLLTPHNLPLRLLAMVTRPLLVLSRVHLLPTEMRRPTAILLPSSSNNRIHTIVHPLLHPLLLLMVAVATIIIPTIIHPMALSSRVLSYAMMLSGPSSPSPQSTLTPASKFGALVSFNHLTKNR